MEAKLMDTNTLVSQLKAHTILRRFSYAIIVG